jgi:membrane protease YdiL (CAAX protease family)
MAYPLGAYLLWFFTVGWAPAFIPTVLRSAFGIELPPWAAQLCIIAVTLFGMFFPAVVITRLADGPAAAQTLIRRAFDARVALGWYALALLAVPAVAAAVAVAFYGPPADVTAPALISAIAGGLLLQTVVHLVTNNLWEEVAVMGFVQARLQARHGAALAAVMTSVVFALQHLPLQSGTAVELGLYVLIATAVMVPFRALMAWVYNRTGSLFAVGLVHAAGNAAAVGSGFGDPLLRYLYPGQSVGVTHVLGIGLVGLAVIAGTRARLGLRVGPASPVRTAGAALLRRAA